VCRTKKCQPSGSATGSPRRFERCQPLCAPAPVEGRRPDRTFTFRRHWSPVLAKLGAWTPLQRRRLMRPTLMSFDADWVRDKIPSNVGNRVLGFVARTAGRRVCRWGQVGERNEWKILARPIGTSPNIDLPRSCGRRFAALDHRGKHLRCAERPTRRGMVLWAAGTAVALALYLVLNPRQQLVMYQNGLELHPARQTDALLWRDVTNGLRPRTSLTPLPPGRPGRYQVARATGRRSSSA